MDRELEGIFSSGCSSFSFGVALPPRWRWRARVAVSCGLICSSGRLTGACSRLISSPLKLPGVVTTFRVCLPRALALWQVLVAMLAAGALELPSVLVLAFHSSLFLVGGSSDGSATGDSFLSPGRMCLIHSVLVEFSRFCAVSV